MIGFNQAAQWREVSNEPPIILRKKLASYEKKLTSCQNSITPKLYAQNNKKLIKIKSLTLLKWEDLLDTFCR